MSSVWIKNRFKNTVNFISENLFSKSLFVTILMKIIKNILMMNFWKRLPGGNVKKYLDYIVSIGPISPIIVIKGLTLTRPLRRKLWIRWFFDVFKVKESNFLNRTSLTPFWCASLVNTNLSPSSYHFSVGFKSRSVLSQMVS